MTYKDKLEELLKEFEIYGDLDGIQDLRPYMKAIENMLNRNKELEEENEKLNQLKEKHNVRINDLCALVDNFAYNSIPVSLVEEKIEELNKQYDFYNSDRRETKSIAKGYYIAIQKLEELLEKRK